MMINEINKLISKYGDLPQFEEKANQAEKEKLFLLKRELVIEYNDYKYGHRNSIDSFIKNHLAQKAEIQISVVDEQDEFYSLFSANSFEGESNIINPNEYSVEGLPDVIEFKSLFQHLIFHKCVLFLDRKMAVDALKSEEKNRLLRIEKLIKSYDQTWIEHKTQILENGIQNLLKTNRYFKERFLNSSSEYFVFQSNYENFGVTNIQSFLDTEIRKTYNYKNYFGKLLTKMKFEVK